MIYALTKLFKRIILKLLFIIRHKMHSGSQTAQVFDILNITDSFNYMSYYGLTVIMFIPTAM